MTDTTLKERLDALKRKVDLATHLELHNYHEQEFRSELDRAHRSGDLVTKDELDAVQKRLALTQAKLYSLEKGVWRDGEPDKVSGSEWFIAETEWRARVVLRRLDDDGSYDYETAEETFVTSERAQIKRWMQFPDSHFLPPDNLVPASSIETALAAEREACAESRDADLIQSYTTGASDMRKRAAAAVREWQAYTKYAQERISDEMADEIETMDIIELTSTEEIQERIEGGE